MRRFTLAALVTALTGLAGHASAQTTTQRRHVGEMWLYGFTTLFPAQFPNGITADLGRPLRIQDIVKLAKQYVLNGGFGTQAERKDAMILFVKALYKADTGKDSLSAADLHDFCQHWLDGIEVGLCAAFS